MGVRVGLWLTAGWESWVCRVLPDTGGYGTILPHPVNPACLGGWLGGGRQGPLHAAERPCVPLPCRFKISKIIVVGDLSVGKTCLINR